ncbi:MAG: CRISPR-associated endonuclease Cas1, partial [Desulfovibrio sp.]|nr:CRISPR-associated endonuclease Cas1 [Desulfovibrio sp.]
GYDLVYNRLVSALRFIPLNPRAGFFHRGRGRHCALASDLMEPLRPFVDGVVLSLIRRREIRPDQFKMSDGRPMFAERSVYPFLLRAFEKMFAREYAFALDGEKISLTLNDCIEEISLGFARHIASDAPAFVPVLTP